MAVIKRDFPNWTSFVDYASLTPSVVTNRRSRDKDTTGFFESKSYDEATKLARGGWREGVAKALSVSTPIESRLYNIIELPRINYDVTGELLDVGRFCAGEPEHWGNFETELHEGQGTKHIRIVLNGSVSGGVPGDTIIGRGAVVSALINLLELAGHRVQVKLVFPTGEFDCTIIVKQFDEPLDLDRVTYAIAHPSTLRRHIFSVMECEPDESVRRRIGVGGGYGYPVDVAPEEQGDIYIPKMHGDERRWQDPEASVQWVKDHLVSLGVIQETAKV